jgi:hypothetical protein
MLFRKLIFVCYENNQATLLNKMHGKNKDFFGVKAGGTYDNRCTLKY